MTEVLLLVSDLVSRQQIKAGIKSNSTYIRDVPALEVAITNSESPLIVLDLDNNKIDLAATLQVIATAGRQEQTLCFFPHIRSELAAQAEEAGFEHIFPRSKFFSNLSALIDD